MAAPPSGAVANLVARAPASSAVTRLQALQRTARDAPSANRAVLQRWASVDPGVNTTVGHKRYVEPASEPVFERKEIPREDFGALIGNLPKDTAVTVTAPFLAMNATKTTPTHGVLTAAPALPGTDEKQDRFTGGVIRTDQLARRRKPKEPGEIEGAETLGAVGGMTGAFDTAAGLIDRGALKEDGKDARKGWLVDKDRSAMSETDRATFDADWRMKHGSEVAAGVGGGIADIVAIGAVIHGWRARKKGEQAQDMVDLMATGSSLVANTTKIVDSSAKVDGGGGTSGVGNAIRVGDGDTAYDTTGSDLAGKMTGNIADLVGVIASVKDCIVSFRDLAKQVQERAKDEASKGDVTKAAVGSFVNLLKLAKGIVTSVRNFQFTLQNAFDSGVSTAVPGLSIAITGIETILHGYETIKSISNYGKMQRIKRDLKKELGATTHQEVAGGLGLREQDLAAKEKERDELQKELDDLDASKAAPAAGKGKSKGKGKGMGKGKGKGKGKGRKKAKGKAGTVKGKGKGKAKAKAKAGADTANGTPDTARRPREQIARDLAVVNAQIGTLKRRISLSHRYEIARAFEHVNIKTERRGITNVILDLTSIAGDLATLSGLGAGVGAGLKIGAGATRGAMVAARHLKQFGRNRAEKQGAWDVTRKVFDARKSSGGKTAARRRIADLVFDQLADYYAAHSDKMGMLPGEKRTAAEAHQEQIIASVRAAGLSWKAWLAVTRADPAKGHAMLVDGQKTRE